MTTERVKQMHKLLTKLARKLHLQPHILISAVENNKEMMKQFADSGYNLATMYEKNPEIYRELVYLHKLKKRKI